MEGFIFMNKKISKALESIWILNVSGLFLLATPAIKSSVGQKMGTVSDWLKQNTSAIKAAYSMSGYAGEDFDAPYDTISQTTMSKYFQTLYKYSPLNEAGTCGFVSLIQLLSYYDTFINDDIIEEKFERRDDYIDPRTPDEKIMSPGVLRKSYVGILYGSPQDWVKKTKEEDYQTELIYRWNEICQDKGALKEDQRKEYQLSMNAFNTRIFANNCLSIEPETNYILNGNGTDIEAWIKNQIDNNTPVLLNILKSLGDDDGHAVIAYDYDENGIIANFGNGSESTHQYVYGAEYKFIESALTLEFDAAGNTNNYVIGGRTFDAVSFFNRAILREGEMCWKHSTDEGEFFDIEVGFAYENGDRESVINGRTSYNCFDFTDRCWLYLQENCYYMYYISVKRYGKYGWVKYPETISYFERSLYD